MIRRTTGWAPRNKHYIFFLFNDVLLWTTKKRELQNVVQLRNCEAMPSDQKTNPNRKFKIISRGQRHKTLLLECTSERQRDEWYKAVEAGIKAAKETSAQAWSKTELRTQKDANEDSDEDDISNAIAKGAPTKEDVVQAVVAAPRLRIAVTTVTTWMIRPRLGTRMATSVRSPLRRALTATSTRPTLRTRSSKSLTQWTILCPKSRSTTSSSTNKIGTTMMLKTPQ